MQGHSGILSHFSFSGIPFLGSFSEPMVPLFPLPHERGKKTVARILAMPAACRPEVGPRRSPRIGVFCWHRFATVETVMNSSRLFLVFLSFLPALARAAEGPIVYRGAVLHTAVGAPIEKGVFVVEGGKII